jgi:hypothetical protein
MAIAKTRATIQPTFQLVQSARTVQDQARSAAEIDEVGQRIELGAESRGSFQHARHAPVDPVETGGEHDYRDHRRLEPALRRPAGSR